MCGKELTNEEIEMGSARVEALDLIEEINEAINIEVADGCPRSCFMMADILITKSKILIAGRDEDEIKGVISRLKAQRDALC